MISPILWGAAGGGRKQFGGRVPVVYNLEFVQPQKSVEEGEARHGGSI